MPYSIRFSKGNIEKRFLRHEHLDKYKFLAFSPTKGGLFCKFCLLFGAGSQRAGRGSQTLGYLVTKPLDRYDRLFGKDGYVTEHETKGYHKDATERSDTFISRVLKASDVLKDIDKVHAKQALESRARLVPIVKTIILCGRQNFALRGHGNYGGPACEDDDNMHSEITKNSGNFRALLQFRVDAGDAQLHKHLMTAASNASYISKTTQNALIDSCAAVITDKIVQRLHQAKSFAILADETSDASKGEQLSLSVRYVLDNNCVHEDFIAFRR